MTQDEIIRMAREAGAVERYFGNQLHGIAFHKKEWLERFASLVAAHEREKQAEQEPVAYDLTTREGCVALAIEKGFERRKLHNSDVEYFVCNSTILHSFVCEALAAPVRTKDLTDDELADACGWKLGAPMYEWVVDIGRWAIAADREKNRAS